MKKKAIKLKLKKVKLVVFDVDGVLTDGNLYYDSSGEALKSFNVKDGLGIKLLNQVVKVALISGNSSKIIQKRADHLGVENCFLAIKDKVKCLEGLQAALNISAADTLFIGDDLNDLVVLPNVGLFFAPKDAHFSVLKQANLVLKKCGGKGVVREVVDMILKYRETSSKVYQSGWKGDNS